MNFLQWLELQGCTVLVTQDDDGSGYLCAEVHLPDDGGDFTTTVSTDGPDFNVTVSQ